MNDYLLQIFNLMELKIGQNQDIYSALELTTNKEANGTKMPGDVRERGARLVCESHIPSASASSTVVSSNVQKFKSIAYIKATNRLK